MDIKRGGIQKTKRSASQTTTGRGVVRFLSVWGEHRILCKHAAPRCGGLRRQLGNTWSGDIFVY